jgi:hypothetical protein
MKTWSGCSLLSAMREPCSSGYGFALANLRSPSIARALEGKNEKNGNPTTAPSAKLLLTPGRPKVGSPEFWTSPVLTRRGMVAERVRALAYHLTEAGLLEKAAGYWVRAGKIAAARFANIEAIADLHRGIAQQGRRVSRILDIRLRRGCSPASGLSRWVR